jgi:uncharacterized protein YcnI
VETRRRIAALLGFALVLTPAAWGHVSVAPAFLTGGETAVLRFATPNERDVAMTGLEITAPPGVDLRPAAPPPGWSLSVADDIATWSDGSLAPRETATFAVEAGTDRAPGTVAFVAVQRYRDGKEVRWEVVSTILPGATPQEHFGRAVVAAIVGAGVIAASLVALRALRRRPPLQER